MYPRIETCCRCFSAVAMDDRKFHEEGVVCTGCGAIFTFEFSKVCITSHR